MSCGVGRRSGSDPALLWLWCKPVDTAPIRPLAWEPPVCRRSGPRNGKKTKINKLIKKIKGKILSEKKKKKKKRNRKINIKRNI